MLRTYITNPGFVDENIMTKALSEFLPILTTHHVVRFRSVGYLRVAFKLIIHIKDESYLKQLSRAPTKLNKVNYS